MIVRRITDGAGYLLNDDRNSGGKREEADLLGCQHCQKLMKIADWKADGAWCGRCFAAVCAYCGDLMQTEGCRPFMKKLDEQLNEAYRRKQNAKVLGL